MYNISKSFEFDYGHRVWTQKLDDALSCSAGCACKHLHGHRGKIEIHLESKELNPQGMVLDFVNLNWFKKFVDDILDHKFIMDINDPIQFKFQFDPLERKELFTSGLNIWVNSKYGPVKKITDEPILGLTELFEGMVFVEFVPTSENLSRFIYKVVEARLKQANLLEEIKLNKIVFWETPKSKSEYYE